jgi:hypothetical protein
MAATDNLTAHAGGGQTNGLLITTPMSRFTTVATAGDSALLPPSYAGLDLILINHGANPMQVFGNGTDQIDDVPTATGVSMMPNSVVWFFCVTPSKWYSEGLATGFTPSLGLQTESFQDTITAHAGGGQGSAYPITKMISRVSVVASANDSVVLPVSAAGTQITVLNGAASNSMNVFPASGEAVNSLGANAAFAAAAGTVTIFTCVTAGVWWTK